MFGLELVGQKVIPAELVGQPLLTRKAIVQEACRNCELWQFKIKNGKPPGRLGWMPRHAVMSIDNQDTDSTRMAPLCSSAFTSSHFC